MNIKTIDEYPEYNEKIGGWVCSGCGVVTSINYDDIGDKRVAPICKKCREDWDKITRRELEVLKPFKESKWTQFNKTFSDNIDFNRLLEDYRKSLGLAVTIDEKLQAIADDYISSKVFKQRYEGQEWFNNLIETGGFSTSMALKWIRYDAIMRFTELPDLFRRDTTKDILKSKDLKVGIAGNDLGVFCILSEG